MELRRADESSLIDAVKTAIADRREELFAFLSGYVQHASVNPRLTRDEAAVEAVGACQRWLADTLRGFGCFDTVDEVAVDPRQPNIVAVRRGSGGGRSLFFNGHSDVVPVTPEQAAAWREEAPFSGAVADGWVWGRGASDMKGGNAAFFWAIKVLHDLGVRLAGDVYATAVIGEETGDRELGIGAVMDRCKLPRHGIIAEATDMDIAPATMGEFYFRIEVQGKSCSLGQRHRAIYPTPYGSEIPGVNAIELMARIQRQLAELERDWGLHRKHPLMEPGNMSINLSQIRGGETYSAMAETCELVGSVLYAPDLTFEEVSGELRRAVDLVAQADTWLRAHPPRVTIPHFIAQKPPNNLPPDHPLCVALEHAWRQVLPGRPRYTCPGSATNDGNYMVERGYETVTFGTRGYGIHGTDERVRCDDLADVAQIYALTMLQWCSPSGGGARV